MNKLSNLNRWRQFRVTILQEREKQDIYMTSNIRTEFEVGNSLSAYLLYIHFVCFIPPGKRVPI